MLDEEEPEEPISKSKLGESSHSFDYDISSDHFSHIIPCNQMHPSSLFKIDKVGVVVTKFEKKEGGIFEQSYVSYFVQTASLGVTV